MIKGIKRVECCYNCKHLTPSDWCFKHEENAPKDGICSDWKFTGEE